MSDAPRWPGADGSSGLNFTPRRGSEASVSPSGDPAPHQPLATGADLARSQASAAEWASRPVVAEGSSVAPTAPAISSAPVPDVDPVADTDAAPAGVQSPAIQSARAAVKETAATMKSGVASAAGAVVNAFRPRVTLDDTEQTDGSATRSAASPSERSGAAVPTSAARASSSVRRTRKARLRLSRLDPWSVMKTSFLFSFAFGIMGLVAVWVLWTVLDGTGALDAINEAMTSLTSGENTKEFRIEDFVNGKRVMGAAMALSGINVILMTAISTLFAFLYNLASTIMGGLEVTLAED